MQVLATNIDWSKVDPIAVQEIINFKKGAGINFLKFLNNGGMMADPYDDPYVLQKVKSDGTTGSEWITRLQKASNLTHYAANFLSEITVTMGKIYKPVVIYGWEFEDGKRTTENVRQKAKEWGYQTPPAELAPILRENISDTLIADMGLWSLIIMHDPFVDSIDRPRLFELNRADKETLSENIIFSSTYHPRRVGFVFLASQE